MIPEAPRPSDEVRARLLAVIAREPSRPRRAHKRLLVVAWFGVVVLLVATTLALRIRLGERSPAAVFLLGLGWAGVGLLSLWVTSLRKSMLGRPLRDCAIVVALASLGLLVTSMTFVALEPPALGSEHPRPMGCLVTALAFGVVPTGVLVWMRMQAGGAPVGSASVGASLAVVGALAGGLVVVLHCPDGSLPHLVLGHVGAVPVAAATGALALVRVLRPRAQMVKSDRSSLDGLR